MNCYRARARLPAIGTLRTLGTLSWQRKEKVQSGVAVLFYECAGFRADAVYVVIQHILYQFHHTDLAAAWFH